ncbi:MAG TPA: serine/threonine-protein kinase [Casimicrobiaceae bacterium]|nr:serine/threonine-protein kinase [Casimicrobiaceae bacterium]
MGHQQLGRYEIIEELGRGSMGVVYRARDPMLDRVVALKTVGLDLSREMAEAFEQRFYREAKSAGRLNHPNIVTIHDVGKSDSVAYIAMEFLQGQSLRAILDSGVVLPADRIVDIAAQVADGLAFAHASGIVHRDIKPPNIMVLDNGSVKITDFGIALLPSGSRTLGGTVFGSPKYMAPEQVVGRQVDGRADVFSLGAVLYEMLTGFAPFFGGDLEAVLYQVINETPAPPSSRNRALPVVFDYIVTRALAKHPQDRYGDARALAADLRNFRDLRPPAVTPPEHQPLERRALRRRKGEIPVALSAPQSPEERAAAAKIAEAVPPVAETAASVLVAADAAAPRRRKILFVGASAAVLVLAAVFALRSPGAKRTASEGRVLEATAAPAQPSDAPAERTTPREAEPVAQAVAPPAAPAVSSSTPVEQRRAPQTAVASKPFGRLALAISPWGEVYVDGKRKGISPPMTELKLAPGKHRIEIRNAKFPPHSETLNVRPGGYAKIRHKFG